MYRCNTVISIRLPYSIIDHNHTHWEDWKRLNRFFMSIECAHIFPTPCKSRSKCHNLLATTPITGPNLTISLDNGARCRWPGCHNCKLVDDWVYKLRNFQVVTEETVVERKNCDLLRSSSIKAPCFKMTQAYGHLRMSQVTVKMYRRWK